VPARNAVPTSLLVAVALLAASAIGAASASAKVRSFKPASTHGHTVLFKLRGLDARSVRSAYLRAGGRRKRLGVRRVRRGVRRGALRIRAPRGVRANAYRAQLYVRLSSRLDTTFSPYAGPYAIPANARHVSPSGSDGNPGTAGEPWKTLDHAAAAAGPGDTVVLHPGSYAGPGQITRLSRSGSAAAPIVFVGEPARPRPRVMGQLRIEGDHVQVHGVLVDGPTGPVADRTSDNPGGEDLELWIRGSQTVLEDSEVRDSRWHAGVYVSDGASGVRVARNHIHHNGDFGEPDQANLDHGVYWDSGSGVVADNLIDHNLAYGVTLYPLAADVLVTRNTITGHGKGGVLVSEDSQRNSIVDNVIARNRLGINTWDLRGEGNVARGNRMWGNWEGSLSSADGLALRNNRAR
jgi:hypothetical protein